MPVAKNLSASIIVGVCMLLFCGLSQSQTLHVPAQFSTIQDAIDASSNGDSIIVAPGRYTGVGNRDLNFFGKAITLKSSDGPQSTVIDCEKMGRGVIFQKGEGRDSQFIGFTITNGYVDGNSFYGGKGGGIHCYNSSPTISNCIVSYCTASGYGGGGIWLNSSAARVENCIIEHNVTETVGAGIAIVDSTGSVVNSIIQHNKTTGYSSGGGIGVVRSNPTLSYLTISYNDSNTDFNNGFQKVTNSGGISFREGSTGTLVSSIVNGNKAQERGGVGSWDAAPVITNCLITGNEATVDGGGGVGFYQNSNATLSKSTIRDNIAGEYGGGVSVWNEFASADGPSFMDLIIENNSAGDSGGAMNILDSSVTISRSIIRGNSADKRAGVALKAVTGSTNSVLVNNVIYENVAVGFGGGVTSYSGGNVAITNCTIVNNRSAGHRMNIWSGGVYVYQARASIANSILWGNFPADNLVTDAAISYSNISGGYSGIGNIDVDPLFVSSSDFHLTAYSECVDTGDNFADYVPAVDLGGNDRVDGRVDIGAYEFPYTSGGPGVSGKLGAEIAWQQQPAEPAGPVGEEGNSAIMFLLLDGK